MKNWQRVVSERLKYVNRVFGVLLMSGFFLYFGLTANAGTIFDSTYVKITGDGKAWTTCAFETHKQYYDKGHTLETENVSSLRLLEAGEHYYEYERLGSIPVGRWIVEHKWSFCVHSSYPLEGEDFHGISFGRDSCGRPYCQGWIAYCADCEEKIIDLLIYMCDGAAGSIDYMETGMDYYYLCPYCTNMEQARLIEGHICKQISKNQYRVIYQVNTEEYYYGVMEDSYHIYDNATSYNGQEIVPDTCLSKLKYVVPGYFFLGWNTEADGSGTWYGDGQTILNLSEYDCNEDGAWGDVYLYAQWGKSGSTLILDPGEGSYQGIEGEQVFFCPAGTEMELDYEQLNPPKGVTVSFETNGGEELSPAYAACYFAEWQKQEPFYGELTGGKYIFSGPDGITDRIAARYDYSGILLPEPVKGEDIFAGWYLDEGLQEEAPLTDGKFYPKEDMTLYAGWKEAPSAESQVLGLRSQVTRILSPHAPSFKRGESGLLTVDVWGYPETVKIEFPDMLRSYNKNIVYDGSEYARQIVVEFMIPIEDAGDGIYEIQVSSTNAQETGFVTNTFQVTGTILDEMRRRLR